jgi:hypothetical protein
MTSLSRLAVGDSLVTLKRVGITPANIPDRFGE